MTQSSMREWRWRRPGQLCPDLGREVLLWAKRNDRIIIIIIIRCIYNAPNDALSAKNRSYNAIVVD